MDYQLTPIIVHVGTGEYYKLPSFKAYTGANILALGWKFAPLMSRINPLPQAPYGPLYWHIGYGIRPLRPTLAHRMSPYSDVSPGPERWVDVDGETATQWWGRRPILTRQTLNAVTLFEEYWGAYSAEHFELPPELTYLFLGPPKNKPIIRL